MKSRTLKKFAIEAQENMHKVKGHISLPFKRHPVNKKAKPIKRLDKFIFDYLDREHIPLSFDALETGVKVPRLEVSLLQGLKMFFAPITHYPDVTNYYTIAFHELGHSTGLEDSLNRGTLTCQLQSFGFVLSTVRHKEELTAQACAYFLAREKGLKPEELTETLLLLRRISKWVNGKFGVELPQLEEGIEAASYVLERR